MSITEVVLFLTFILSLVVAASLIIRLNVSNKLDAHIKTTWEMCNPFTFNVNSAVMVKTTEYGLEDKTDVVKWRKGRIYKREYSHDKIYKRIFSEKYYDVFVEDWGCVSVFRESNIRLQK